jgi:hypothetical protein
MSLAINREVFLNQPSSIGYYYGYGLFPPEEGIAVCMYNVSKS